MIDKNRAALRQGGQHTVLVGDAQKLAGAAEPRQHVLAVTSVTRALAVPAERSRRRAFRQDDAAATSSWYRAWKLLDVLRPGTMFAATALAASIFGRPPRK